MNTAAPAPARAAALEVRDLDVELGGAKVLRGFSCRVAAGGWLALIGPNGAGKSTLLRAIAGLLPYRGRVEAGGTDTARLPRRELARLLAYVPQSPVIPPDMTVLEYVLLGRTPLLGYLAVPGRADRDAADRSVERLDLARFADRPMGTLSGGERQRAVLARALAQQPRLLLLDEPTSALDIGHQQQVLDLVDGLRRTEGLTVLSSLHDLTCAGQYADELVLLDRGATAASGPARDVLTEERIARTYHARVAVTEDATGRPVVTPVRRRPGE
ncbi:MAG TPA: ABC transporter ATP-binding protein [Actinocrinis sp.]|jgi:iron complex transport system ATP-binding protein